MPRVTIKPFSSTVFQEATPAKRQAFPIVAGQAAAIELALMDIEGNPLDLSAYLEDSVATAQARFYEPIKGPESQATGVATIDNPATNTVDITVPMAVANHPGIYICECCIKADNAIQHVSRGVLYVERSAWQAAPKNIGGPPAIQEVMQSVKQSDLLENLIRTEWVYDLSDICDAAIRAVNYWNEQLPIIRRATYTTSTMPYRDTWLTGIQLFLFSAAEEWYRRNKLAYNAGGTKTDDMDRDIPYKHAWQERMKMYQQSIMNIKTRINLQGGYASYGGFAQSC